MQITVDILIELFKLMLQMGPAWSLHQRSFGVDGWDGTTYVATVALNGMDLFQVELREYFEFSPGVKFTQLVTELPDDEPFSRTPWLVMTEIESILRQYK